MRVYRTTYELAHTRKNYTKKYEWIITLMQNSAFSLLLLHRRESIFIGRDRKERRLFLSRRRNSYSLWHSTAWHFTEEHIKNSKYSNSLLSSLVLNILSIVRSFVRSFILSIYLPFSLSFRFLVRSDYRYSFNDASLLYTYLCFSG